VLAAQTDAPLELIAHAAAAAADADLATLTVFDGDDSIRLRAGGGALGDCLDRACWPADDMLVNQAVQSATPQMVAIHPEEFGAALGFDFGPKIVVSFVAGDLLRIAISFYRASNRPGFTSADMEMAEAFAKRVTQATGFIDARTDQMQLAVLEDQSRIAEGLHDDVIQELFATGMSLQSLVSKFERVEDSERLAKAVGTLDNVISRIRATIIELRPDRDKAAPTVADDDEGTRPAHENRRSKVPASSVEVAPRSLGLPQERNGETL
jgi:signal transduction histidine kinase